MIAPEYIFLFLFLRAKCGNLLKGTSRCAPTNNNLNLTYIVNINNIMEIGWRYIMKIKVLFLTAMILFGLLSFSNNIDRDLPINK